MAYYNELSFASGYYSIYNGIVEFREGTPREIKERFWKVWPEFRAKVIANEKRGYFSSIYPVLPITDEDPNKPYKI